MAYDVIIVGNGPAGLSAALYTSRANLKTLVIGKDDGALTKADRIEKTGTHPWRGADGG